MEISGPEDDYATLKHSNRCELSGVAELQIYNYTT